MDNETECPVRVEVLLKAYSMATSLSLVIISFFGFKDLDDLADRKSSLQGVETATSSACLSFLGICFGTCLFLSETNWKEFNRYFKFLEFRIGRAIIFLISGIMIFLMGKLYGDECECSDYIILLVIGLACIAAGVLHVTALFLFKKSKPFNNSVPELTPSSNDGTEITTTMHYENLSTNELFPITTVTKPPQEEDTPEPIRVQRTQVNMIPAHKPL